MVKFDEATHTYTLPSVTEIIRVVLFPNQFAYVAEEVMERAVEFGKNVHKALELSFPDLLTEEETHSYNEAVRIMAENGITPLEHEVVIYSQLGYAGKLDLYATMGDKKILVDFKTGSLHKEKTAWQQSLYKREREEKGFVIDEIYALHIPRGKKGRLVRLEPKTDDEIKWLCSEYERVTNENNQ